MTFDPRLIEAEIRRLHRLTKATLNGVPAVLPQGAISGLDDIERRLLEAVRRDNTGDAVHDGYPSGRAGNGGEDAAQSSTEAALMARYDDDGNERTVHDPHHELTAAAVDALCRATAAVASLYTKLDEIDRKAKIARTDPSGYCAACTRWVTGTAEDRIRSAYCPACYQAWHRAGRPDRPTFEQSRAARVEDEVVAS